MLLPRLELAINSLNTKFLRLSNLDHKNHNQFGIYVVAWNEGDVGNIHTHAYYVVLEYPVDNLATMMGGAVVSYFF